MSEVSSDYNTRLNVLRNTITYLRQKIQQLEEENRKLKALIGKYQVEYLAQRVQQLEEENKNLKKALMQLIEKKEIEWKNIATNTKYDKIILEVILDFIKKYQRPVRFKEVWPEIKKRVMIRFHHTPNPETISRRMRKMREEGLLASPAIGEYTIPPNEGDTRDTLRNSEE